MVPATRTPVKKIAAKKAAAKKPLKKKDSSSKVLQALVVDDQEIGRDLLMEILHLFGLEVKLADSSKEAMKEYELRKFDCVFLDLRMPEIDGYQLVREMRRRELTEKRKPASIVAYSAEIFVDANREISPRDLEKFAAHGFDYCIPKPIRKKDIELYLTYYQNHMR